MYVKKLELFINKKIKKQKIKKKKKIKKFFNIYKKILFFLI